MFKTHSAGIGDLLRSSAAWRALKNHFPQAELHLLLLTRDPGYNSERFIARHHLLTSFRSLDKRTKGLADWRKLLRQVGEYTDSFQPDLIVDFEPNGVRTSILAFWLAWRHHARTIGIGEVLGRGIFYQRASVSTNRFAAQRNLAEGFDYTTRDFVALSVLGIERGDTAIELEETAEGREFRQNFRRRFGLPEDARLLGLNIGCGTPDADKRRPSLPLVSKLAAHLQTVHGLHLVVGLGAPFESKLDQQFLELHRQNCNAPVTDLGGKISLLELSGLIKTSSLFVSGDTGPYHMAVALRTPTLAIFNWNCTVAFHHHAWVKCLLATSPDDLPRVTQAADELLKTAAVPATS
ncbi:MAG: glycosyl transferase family 9 [Pedosphaera sp.]|nr:glycosyl transferase family 9 [Pedosphaera sp.]